MEEGHDVTLFASGDSTTAAHLDAAWPNALRLDNTIRDRVAPHMLLMEAVYRRAKEFDILHFHMDYWPFSLFSRQSTPFLTTLHGRLDLPELRPLFDAFRDVAVVSVSESQRRPLAQANYVATVLHGIPRNLLKPCPGRPSYLAFLGRIAPEKRPDIAIRIARSAGIPLKIAAKVDRVDVEYFQKVIKPMLAAGGVEMIGEIGDQAKAEFLSGAIGLLMPIDWPEPFGLVMIEAMACGTPVIAFDRGAVAEIVDAGVTGFIVRDEEGAVAAVRHLSELPRQAVRLRFEERFTARRMAQDYLDCYQRLLAANHGDAPVVNDKLPLATTLVDTRNSGNDITLLT